MYFNEFCVEFIDVFLYWKENENIYLCFVILVKCYFFILVFLVLWNGYLVLLEEFFVLIDVD